jgi:predicted nuclease of predicted toxin-antitoxin system
VAPRTRSAGQITAARRRLLLDEMLSGSIAVQLRARGHDVVAVAEDTALIGLSDDEILAAATTVGRALVTANIRDFVPIDQRYKATGRPHPGLVLVSAKSFPQNRSFIGALVGALDRLLLDDSLRAETTMFLPSRSETIGPPSPET